MKSIGIVRKIDDLGRITLPKELRDIRGLKQGDPMEIFVDEDKIVLQPYKQKDNTLVKGLKELDTLVQNTTGIGAVKTGELRKCIRDLLDCVK